MVNKTSFYRTNNVCEFQATWNSETVLLVSKSTGWNSEWYTSICWIDINIFRSACVKLRIGLENFKGVLARVWFIAIAFLSLQLRSTKKLFVDPTPMEKFVSQVVTWPAASRVSLLNDKGGKGERAWDRGCDTLGYGLVCHFFVLTTFWRHLWFITEQTHGNMESIC